MKSGARMGVLVVAAIAVAAGAGYGIGKRTATTATSDRAAATTAAGEQTSVQHGRKLLYYRNPMGLPDTSPTPKKDAMGMDYVAVYEGEDAIVDDGKGTGANQIVISTDKVQKLGVRTEAARVRPLGKVVRAAGRIEPDERRVHVVAPKFEGYVERLHVNATGQPVGKGQALFDVYSPDLVSAQREYAIAAQGMQDLNGADAQAQAGMRELAEASLTRLRNWDIPAEQLRALEKSGAAKRTLTLRSPVSGIVTEKKAVQGMRFMPGEALFQITDLSSVWVVADVFEQDIAMLSTGAQAVITVDAYPGRRFDGRVSYIYPTLNVATRTVQVRIELDNHGQMFKPGMFAHLELAAAPRAPAVTVPVSAVIDSGTRRIVLVRLSEGRFEPRTVSTGLRGEDYIEVLNGVGEGEQVVVAANFLIDAESNLKAAVAGFGHAGHGASTSAPADSKTPPVGQSHEHAGH
jgi:RND family efflux transporter MFP subunit